MCPKLRPSEFSPLPLRIFHGKGKGEGKGCGKKVLCCLSTILQGATWVCTSKGEDAGQVRMIVMLYKER